MLTYTDHGGEDFAIAEVTGLTVATWADGDDDPHPVVAPAYRHEDGTVFIPSDATLRDLDRYRGEYIDNETGELIGRWVEATTAQEAVLVGGVPVVVFEIPRGRGRPQIGTKAQITLPDEMWAALQGLVDAGEARSRAEAVRILLGEALAARS